MEEKRINEIQRKVIMLLREERLKQAIGLLAEEIDSLGNWDLRSRFIEVQRVYGYMLEYMGKGVVDPNRAALHKEFIGKIFLLNDEIAAARMAEHSVNVYCQMRRKFKEEKRLPEYHDRLRELSLNKVLLDMMPDSDAFAVREFARKHEDAGNEFFMYIFSRGAWSSSELSEAESFLADIETDLCDKEMLVSAVTVSLMKIFDPQKAILLCAACEHEESAIALRAMVGLAIVTYVYSYRIGYYPELKSRIELLGDIPGFASRLFNIQMQLLRSRETQKIDRKMREEIIPAMLKNPNIRNVKLGVDLEKELEQEEMNPEWESWLNKDEIRSKLDEMAQWQIEGADVYMGTFSQLKNFPFFNEMANWFRPFDIRHSSVVLSGGKEPGGSPIMKGLLESRFFCNSDKYSFAFTIQQVPEEQRSMLMQQMGAHDGDNIQLPDAVPQKLEDELLSNRYIQDLYRFFKIASFKKEFVDPFTLSLNLLEDEWLGAHLCNREQALNIFHYLVKKEYFSEAFSIGRKLEKSAAQDECESQFYQEMGYCKQKAGEFDEALKYYHKADIVAPENLWTVRHIGQCYRMNHNSKAALPYYMQAEELAPENCQILMQTGELLAALKKYDEAFKRFFKVEYIEPQSHRTWRAIAWYSFVTDDFERARKYYEKLLASSARTMQDWLNAAHVELVSGNSASAIEYYRNAFTLCKDSDEFSETLMGDKKVLSAKGVSISDLVLIRDVVS